MRTMEMLKKVSMGEIKSINRSKAEILRNKIEKGGLIASSWYLKGDTRKVISCQPTLSGILAKKLSKALNGDKGQKRTLVTEDGGLPIICSLKRADPF